MFVLRDEGLRRDLSRFGPLIPRPSPQGRREPAKPSPIKETKTRGRRVASPAVGRIATIYSITNLVSPKHPREGEKHDPEKLPRLYKPD